MRSPVPSARSEISASSRSARQVMASFRVVKPDDSWSFSELTTGDTGYASHGYHSYPAKFIPHLAARLIRELTEPGEWVLDPFMGSGTTLVEAKCLGRPSLGVDINPVAHLISQAKTAVIDPKAFQAEVARLERDFAEGRQGSMSLWPHPGSPAEPEHERIDYWFPPEIKTCLAKILWHVEKTRDEDIKKVLRCAFSNSLKTSSIWMQRSIKPTRDYRKKIPDPRDTFLRQVKRSARGNKEFYDLLESRGHLDVPAQPHCEDARNLPARDGQISLVVTSPPYATSYEYADLHQLSALWFHYVTDLPSFRKQFIGTAHPEEKALDIDSDIGEEIVGQLRRVKPKVATEVATYFTDLRQVFLAVKNKLRSGGRACIVVGNTNLLDVDILNAQVFVEQMMRMGFALDRLIYRRIPCKILPQVREKSTGRFTSAQSADFLAYPHEYILVMRKP